VSLYELQDGLVTRGNLGQLHALPPGFNVLSNGPKFYMSKDINEILVCDFLYSTISTIELRDGVEYNDSQSIMLYGREGFGFV
jgi:hypothetical protein